MQYIIVLVVFVVKNLWKRVKWPFVRRGHSILVDDVQRLYIINIFIVIVFVFICSINFGHLSCRSLRWVFSNYWSIFQNDIQLNSYSFIATMFNLLPSVFQYDEVDVILEYEKFYDDVIGEFRAAGTVVMFKVINWKYWNFESFGNIESWLCFDNLSMSIEKDYWFVF